MKHSTFLLLFIFTLFFSVQIFSQQQATLGKLLTKQLPELLSDETTLIIVYFKDKGTQHLAATSPSQLLSERALNRRAKVRPSATLIDEQDLPLEQSYVKAVENIVTASRHQLKWFNALSAMATSAQISAIRNLPFVREIELIGRWKTDKESEQETPLISPVQESSLSMADSLNYGTGLTQVNQINVPAVHNLGIYGQGIVVGVFDNGFRLPGHESFASMNIIATYDFVDHKKSVVPNNPSTSFGSHGVNTLSTVGGYKSGQLIGPAFGSTYILARTENDSSETPVEEDNWAKAIEWADSIGVDVTSTSLGYLTFDSPYTSWTWQDMNGNTTLITKAADRAAGLGIVVVNSAGNDGSSTHNTLGAPADGDSVISVGAVDASGTRSSFSSVGPTTDIPARIKPDIMAMGSGVKVASSTNTTGYGSSSGTSFSCPLSAGVAALILCANPSLTPMQVREAMRQTANNSSSPNNNYGWGILNARNAISYYGIKPSIRGFLYNDLDADGVKDTNETGIPGKLVRLTGTKTDSTYTDSDGGYLFDSLSVGTFSVSFSDIPSGKKLLFPSNGSFGITVDSAHLVQSGKNFSVVQYATVAGSVYEDLNGNGTQQGNELGIGGWKVKLGSGISAITDAGGIFNFSQADAGTYALSESLQTGWMQTAPASNFTLNISYGQTLSGYKFGIFEKGVIHGVVFEDFNSNALRDSGETGIPGWTISVTGPVSTSAISDSNGMYTISNLTPGTYTITENPISSWLQTFPVANGNHSVQVAISGFDTTGIDFGNYFAPHVAYAVNQGWNLLSLPQYVADNSVNTVYPSAQSQLFTFSEAYTPQDTVPQHEGYWLKFTNPQNVSVTGDLKSDDTIAVKTGWNIIGSLSDPLAIESIISEPDSIIESAFYNFNGGYFSATSLTPHKGYWVKVKSDGILILHSTATRKEYLRRNSLSGH